VSIDQQVTLAAFFETYWRLHAVPNLTAHTRAAYKQTWTKHLRPRLGDRHVAEITPGIVARLRSDLEKAGVGVAAVRKAMAVLQSVLSFAIVEGITEFNAAASVKKPRYVRARQPPVFSPVEVEHLRCLVATARDRALISALAYSGARPEEVLRLAWPDVGREALHYHDQKRGHRERWTPLLDHLRRACATGT
jgi:integrase